MSKVKFVLALAILGIAFFIWSCSTDEVAKAQCTATQGEWNEATKQCESCPQGTTKYPDGQCVASAIQKPDGTFICPPGTTQNADGLCVAGIIKIDPNAKSGEFYCDYGEPDPKAETKAAGCFEIEYQNQCDADWGKLVPSCQSKDRRKDLKYCDYGPVSEYGGGCYLTLNGSDCDKDWGIIANKCGTQIQWPGGTVCPTGEGSTILPQCSGGSPNNNNNNNNNSSSKKYCYLGSATNCWEIGPSFNTKTEAGCEADYGMVVTDCNNVVLDYCDWGQPTLTNGQVERGCWAIRNAKNRSDCQLYGTIRPSCPDYSNSCPAGTKPSTDSGFGDSGCELE